MTKMRLFTLAIIGLFIVGCNDATIDNNAAVLDSGGDGSGLYNVRLGQKTHGYAQLTFTQTAASDNDDSIGIMARANSKENLYTCSLYTTGGNVLAVITRTKNGSSGTIADIQLGTAAEMIGTHYLGCEIKDEGDLDRITLYYDPDANGPAAMNTIISTTLGDAGNDTDPVANGFWGFDGLDGGATTNDRKVSNFTYAAEKETTFYFDVTTRGINGVEAFNSSGFPFGTGSADVRIARFFNANAILPTCTASNFVTNAFPGDGNGDCDGTNTPTIGTCTCYFDEESTVAGQCRVTFNNICASLNADVGFDIGDSISLDMQYTAPSNFSTDSNISVSYDWFVQNND